MSLFPIEYMDGVCEQEVAKEEFTGISSKNTPAAEPEPAVQAKEPAGPVPKKTFRAKADPSVLLQIKLYQDRTKAQQYRAYLTVKDVSKPHCVHYCNSMAEAVTWGKEKGEQALLKKLDIGSFHSVPKGITIKTIYLLMKDTPEAKNLQPYFRKNEGLLDVLSEVPLAKLDVEACGSAIKKIFPKEADRREAADRLNEILGLCHMRGLLPEPVRLKYNGRKEDKNLRALRNALLPRVLPQEMCQNLYHTSREKIREDPYYLAIVMRQ